MTRSAGRICSEFGISSKSGRPSWKPRKSISTHRTPMILSFSTTISLKVRPG